MDYRASVAMAVYNGEKYLAEQIDSILALMGEQDELVISYDVSTDQTLQIIQGYAGKDTRVKIVLDDGKGLESNFNNAVKHCSGKYIFLADQDDVWINNKIEEMVQFFEKNRDAVVLISDGYITDSHLKIRDTIFKALHTTPSPLFNFVKGSYLGCQMAFCTSIRDKVWPVRENPPLPHDLWLGVQGAKYGKVKLLHKYLIKHRLHDANYTLTSKMKFMAVIQNRVLFFKEYLKRR